MSNLLITNIGQLVTNDPVQGGPLGIVESAAVGIRDGLIGWVGDSEAVPDDYLTLPAIDAAGVAVVPGFVDAHTHAVFAGDRSHEHALRLSGTSYSDIQASGGGIYSTVRATREASLTELVLGSRSRVARMLESGTTTVEIKTGYGLDVPNEVKMLDVISRYGAMKK